MVDPASARSQAAIPPLRATPAALAAGVRSACPGMLNHGSPVHPAVGPAHGPESRRPACWRPRGKRGVRCRSVPDSTVPTSTTFPATSPAATEMHQLRRIYRKGGVPGCGPLRQSMRNGSVGRDAQRSASRTGKLGLPSSAEAGHASGRCRPAYPSPDWRSRAARPESSGGNHAGARSAPSVPGLRSRPPARRDRSGGGAAARRSAVSSAGRTGCRCRSPGPSRRSRSIRSARNARSTGDRQASATKLSSPMATIAMPRCWGSARRNGRSSDR